MKNKVTPLGNLNDPHVRNKILNPNQRQLLEDTRRFKEKMDQLRQGMVLIKRLLNIEKSQRLVLIEGRRWLDLNLSLIPSR